MGSPHQWFGDRTYSQHGDDFVILNIFKRLGIEHPSYIDIGAHHPFDLSNTALLYQSGSRGINVEPNPDMMPMFYRYRPEDKNVQAAVVTRDDPLIVKLYRGSNPGINSILLNQVKPHGIVDSIDVSARRADEIVDDYANGVWPDFLSLDAEGKDAAIIMDIDWDKRNGPKVICVEAQTVSSTESAAEALRHALGIVGYYVHSWCGMNMIFVRNKLKHLLH